MGYYYFKCRSITFAQRASKFLYGKGIYTTIIKMPLKYSKEGCGYSIKVSQRQFVRAYNLLNKSEFAGLQVLFSKDNNVFEEVDT